MPSKLKGRAPDTVKPSKPKILVFGPAGVGKTTFALDFPDVFYIDTEGGADLPQYTERLRKSNASYLGPDDGACDFQTVLEQVQALATEDHDRKTLVIDSFSKLFNTQIVHTQEKMAKAGQEDAFGASKKEAIACTRRLIAWMGKLDMNVILICHQKSQWKDGKEVGVTFDGWDKLDYELHLALRVAKNGPNRIAYTTKSRLQQFPDGDSFSWSFPEFAKRYGADVINAAVQKAALATEAQLAEHKDLLTKVKLSQDAIDKLNASGEPELLEESKMALRLDWLRKQLAAQTAKSA